MLSKSSDVDQSLALRVQTETTDANSALALIRDLPVTTQAEIDAANLLLGQTDTLYKQYETERKSLVGPINSTVKRINDLFRPVLTAYSTASSILRAKIATAVDAAQKKQDAALQTIMQSPVPVGVEVLSIAHGGEIVEAPTNISIIKSMKFEVTDANAVPTEYKMLVPDLEKIKLAVSRGITDIPGIRVYEESSVRRRS